MGFDECVFDNREEWRSNAGKIIIVLCVLFNFILYSVFAAMAEIKGYRFEDTPGNKARKYVNNIVQEQLLYFLFCALVHALTPSEWPVIFICLYSILLAVKPLAYAKDWRKFKMVALPVEIIL